MGVGQNKINAIGRIASHHLHGVTQDISGHKNTSPFEGCRREPVRLPFPAARCHGRQASPRVRPTVEYRVGGRITGEAMPRKRLEGGLCPPPRPQRGLPAMTSGRRFGFMKSPVNLLTAVRRRGKRSTATSLSLRGITVADFCI